MRKHIYRNYPLFQSHLDLAHTYWERLLQKGDWAIDATCGSGNDTLVLAKILLHHARSGCDITEGAVIGIDLQEEAIKRTSNLLQANLPADILAQVYLYRQSHIDFPKEVYEHSVKLVVYNLGYLPKSNKKLTTMTQTTLASAQKALGLLVPGGAVSITCYPGHLEGATEERALIEWASVLPASEWNVCHHRFPNRPSSPNLLLIQKSSDYTRSTSKAPNKQTWS